MKRTITNRDIDSSAWERNFTRDELRKIAAKHRIYRGDNKAETAEGLSFGYPQNANDDAVEFPVTIEVK